ncbi:MAG: hypothetical protein LBL00_08195 [Endomicrobium sp.]|jgi:hypothetical protein|nr:hypothetical protein [Endomicrobium sp.]
MKIRFWITLIVLAGIFAAINAAARNAEKKNAPTEQNIETIGITVTAPPLSRRELSEQNIKERLKDKVKTVYFYSSSYKKADYIVHYCEYKNKANLRTAIEASEAKFKDNNFLYKVTENKVGYAEGVLLEGTFEIDGKKFAIKQQLITDKTHFWQALCIYPDSARNEKAAGEFIKSVSVGSPKSK